MLIVSIPTFAGGILTNTNQHVSFLRMLARGASIDIDGVYSNPAGLAFLPEDGLYLSLNGQSAYQTRNIKATFPLFIEDGNTRYYKGKASAPFIPSFQGAYKKGDWTISGSFAVVGGGGKASFDDGTSGGIAYIYDPNNDLYEKLNGALVEYSEVNKPYDIKTVRELIENHYKFTGSEKAKMFLDDFKTYIGKFKKIIPHDYKKMMDLIAYYQSQGLDEDQAKVEAFNAAMKGGK